MPEDSRGASGSAKGCALLRPSSIPPDSLRLILAPAEAHARAVKRAAHAYLFLVVYSRVAAGCNGIDPEATQQREGRDRRGREWAGCVCIPLVT